MSRQSLIENVKYFNSIEAGLGKKIGSAKEAVDTINDLCYKVYCMKVMDGLKVDEARKISGVRMSIVKKHNLETPYQLIYGQKKRVSPLKGKKKNRDESKERSKVNSKSKKDIRSGGAFSRNGRIYGENKENELVTSVRGLPYNSSQDVCDYINN